MLLSDTNVVLVVALGLCLALVPAVEVGAGPTTSGTTTSSSGAGDAPSGQAAQQVANSGHEGDDDDDDATSQGSHHDHEDDDDALSVSGDSWTADHYDNGEPHDEYHDDGGHGDRYEHEPAARPPHRAMDPALMKTIVQEEMEEEELDEQIENEQDPVKKLQMELARERKRNKALLKQLDANRYEIEDLLEEKHNYHKSKARQAGDGSSSSVLDENRFEMMKSMYEQASERERVANEKVSELSRQLAEARSMLANQAGDWPSNKQRQQK
jgi:hypothetical protein